jgi:hypothetical protein
VLSGIAVECKSFCENVDALKGFIVHKDIFPEAEHALPHVRKQASQQLSFIQQSISDLQALDEGGAGIQAGKR